VSDCLFCKIVRKEIPARIVDEDADTLTFEDINPQAPVHLLVVPKKHIATGNDVGPEDEALLGKLFRAGARAARAKGVADSGWRGVVNVNRDAFQLVFHLHLHVLGGRSMSWPPG
jgi:histidine triad (HIT) family protein